MAHKGSATRVVILGGYGVFGGRLAQALLRDPQFEVIVAGRRRDVAEDFCRRRGGVPAVLDTAAPDFAARLAALAPAVTVDATGPFQARRDRPYRVAEAALACGSHYLDLSDDAEFTEGIAALDGRARVAGRVVLSGASSVPALSSAAVEAVLPGFQRVDLIDSMILPGNRAPRGLSVIRAILAQAGRKVALTRDGAPGSVPGWSGLARRRLGPDDRRGLPPRWTSFIGAPDLRLFPAYYRARTVLFRAGLELPLLHLGLRLMASTVRLGVLRSLDPFAGPVRTLAGWFERFGTDRGGMEVRVAGLGQTGQPHSRTWSLIAEAGDGPHVPAVPAAILCRKLLVGGVAPGARACLGAFSLADIDAATAHLSIRTVSAADSAPTLFQQALGGEFDGLPQPVRELHTVFDRRAWTGEARVTRGTTALGTLVCSLIGFPPESAATPVSVTIERRGEAEHWQRKFGGKAFNSVLSLRGAPGSGIVQERFGPLGFDIHLTPGKDSLAYPVLRGRMLGIPLPRRLLPASDTLETGADGAFHFDVAISLPLIGLLVRYRGRLRPKNEEPAAHELLKSS